MTEQQCQKAVQKVYPGYDVDVVAEDEQHYYVHIHNTDEALADFHRVNKVTGAVSGNIATMKFLSNDRLREQMERRLKKKTDDHLAHYGIKGQTWGTRHGPPYPLDQKTHDAVVKGKNKKPKANVSGSSSTETATAVAVFLSAFIGVKVMNAIDNKRGMEKATEDFHRYAKARNNALSDKYMSDFADVRDFSDDNPPKKIKGKHSIEDDANATNPLYNDEKPETVTNCTLCTTTYDLRRRGYDVTSKLCDTGMSAPKVLDDLYEGKRDKLKMSAFTTNWDKVAEKAVSHFPEGTRGHLSIRSQYANMGHSMAFEIQNGKLRIIDAQSADTNVNLKDKKWSMFTPGLTTFSRLDNLKVKTSNIGISSAELKDGWQKKVPARSKPGTSDKRAEKYRKEASDAARKARARETDDLVTIDYIQRERQFVREYRQEHPNTKLTDKRIADMMRR